MNLKLHLEMIDHSYTHFTGKFLPLSPCENLIQAFDQCIYPIASHDNSDEPLFNYANQAALNLFKMTSHEMIGLPSKASALVSNQEDRSLLLKQVTERGFIQHYEGQRVASDRSLFNIEDATVWNLIDGNKKYYGQAVIIFKSSLLND